MKHVRLIALAAFCLGLLACSQQALMDKLAPKAESTFAKNAIEQLRDGNFTAIETNLDPRYMTADIDSKLRELAACFPAGNPDSLKIVGSYHTVRHGSGGSSDLYNLTYEYQFDHTTILSNILLSRRGDKLLIEGIHARKSDQSLEAANAFSIGSKDITHWLVLVLTTADALFCLYAFVLCLRTPLPRRKWLWALFTLIGVTTLHFNWTTGDFSFQAISVQLFSASVLSSSYGPWMLSLSIPIGAILFLVKRRKLQTSLPTPPPMPPRGKV